MEMVSNHNWTYTCINSSKNCSCFGATLLVRKWGELDWCMFCRSKVFQNKAMHLGGRVLIGRPTSKPKSWKFLWMIICGETKLALLRRFSGAIVSARYIYNESKTQISPALKFLHKLGQSTKTKAFLSGAYCSCIN